MRLEKEGAEPKKMEAVLAMTAVLAKMALTVLFGGFVVYIYNNMVLGPRRMRSKLQKQGIRGPSPSIPLGSIPEMKKIQLQVRSRTHTPNDRLYDVVSIGHDWPSTVLSHLIQWRNEYGNFLSIILCFTYFFIF